MQNSIEEILAILREPMTLSGKADRTGNRRDFDVTHQMGRPLDKRKFRKWMPPSLKQLLAQFNGAILFRPGQDFNAGFVFYSAQEIAQETKDLQEIFDEQREAYQEDSGYDKLDEWLAGLVPIAAPRCSGNRYVLDTLNRRSDGECPILLLDHENYYGGVCSPCSTDQIAATCLEFIGSVIQNPLTYSNCCWHDEATGEQWRIDALALAGQALPAKELKAPQPNFAKLPNVRPEFDVKKVLLADLTLPVHKFTQADRFSCLSAPLLNGRLCVVRVIAPSNTIFCDVDIYWPWIVSMLQWAKTISAKEKAVIRKEQKAAGWKSDHIFHDGPSIARYRNYLDFCVLFADENIPVEYVKSQVASFDQPLILDERWKLDIKNIQGPEGELAHLVGDFHDDQLPNRVAALKLLCRNLEEGIPQPIQTTVRARRGLLSILSIGPNYKTGQLEDQHVWRAHLLRLLGWPGGILLARAALALTVDAQVIGNDGNPMDWRGELRAYEQDIVRRHPMIDLKYEPGK